MRRWVGIAGILVAVTAGTAATARGLAGDEFEAEVSLLLERPTRTGAAVQLLDGPERLLETPGVSERVRARLGGLPPVRVTAETDDTVLVRSRATTPWQAAEAAETYAASYVDVRRRQIEAEAAAATEDVRRQVVEVESQLVVAEEPQRASLIGVLHLFNQQLDRLQLDMYGPGVVGSAPARPVGHGARGPSIITALGVTMGVGAAVSAHRSGRRTRPESGAVPNGP